MEYVKIYLSGGMGNLSIEERSEWRKKIIDFIKFYEEGYRKKPIFFNPVDYYGFEVKRHKTEREVFEYDLYNLRDSDLVVVNFNDPKSTGTSMELILAKEYRIPVIAYGVDNKEIHPWLFECCTRICDSLEEVVEHICEFYLN